jgi:hypothetical protein
MPPKWVKPLITILYISLTWRYIQLYPTHLRIPSCIWEKYREAKGKSLRQEDTCWFQNLFKFTGVSSFKESGYVIQKIVLTIQYSVSSSDSFKSHLQLAVELSHVTISPIKRLLLISCGMYLTTTRPIANAFNSTQKWSKRLKRGTGFRIVTRLADKENLPPSYLWFQEYRKSL